MIAPTPENQVLSLNTRALPSEMAVQHICRSARPQLGEWVEFLIRPKAGMRHLSPLKFVEQGYRRRGLLFDQDVFEQCMESAVGLAEATHFSVNVHPSSMERDKFASFVLGSMDAWGVEPGRLVLELVEFGGPVDLMASRAVIEELRSHSIRIALDDFGPGFSNLDLIAAGLVDFVKIDRSLVRFVDLHPGHLRLLHGLREFARSTGTSLVAEGVENAAQFELLRDLDIEWIQGFEFSRPEVIAPVRVRSEA
jgi:EAL domain-containing protein (putative c-di-GMP-specific phosphodiesterase class I)